MDIQRDFNAYRDDQANLVFFKYRKNCSYLNLKLKLDVDPRRDDDASPMSSYRCLLRPT